MQNHIVNQITQDMRQRSEFYRLLASLYFKEVSEDTIASLRALPAELSEEDSRLGRGFSELRSCMAHCGPDPRTDFACDYARIFLAAGMYRGDAGCPFESIYTSEEKLVMQDARDEVVAIYRANEIDVDESLHLPEDHLSFELEFIAILSDRASLLVSSGDIEGFADNLETQISFIDAHLLNWLDDLEGRVVELARQRFYPAVMHITQGFIEQDRLLLDEYRRIAKEELGNADN